MQCAASRCAESGQASPIRAAGDEKKKKKSKWLGSTGNPRRLGSNKTDQNRVTAINHHSQSASQSNPLLGFIQVVLLFHRLLPFIFSWSHPSQHSTAQNPLYHSPPLPPTTLGSCIAYPISPLSSPQSITLHLAFRALQANLPSPRTASLRVRQAATSFFAADSFFFLGQRLGSKFGILPGWKLDSKQAAPGLLLQVVWTRRSSRLIVLVIFFFLVSLTARGVQSDQNIERRTEVTACQVSGDSGRRGKRTDGCAARQPAFHCASHHSFLARPCTKPISPERCADHALASPTRSPPLPSLRHGWRRPLPLIRTPWTI